MQMAEDASRDNSISGKRDFWFQMDNGWVKKKKWLFDGWDMDVLTEDVSKMTYERIVKHFGAIGFRNPKKVFVKDPDRNFEDGLYLIEDEESCKRVLQYIEVLGTEIELFIDHDKLPMPEFTPQALPTDLELDMGARDDCVGIENADMGDDYDELLKDYDIGDIPTQSSRPNIQESTYVNPLGYVSSEEDEEEVENGEEELDKSEAKNLEERVVRFTGEGSEVRQPSSLPFKPPGLQWNGASSITTRQLLEKRDTTRRSRSSSIAKATSDSTTTNMD